MCKVALFLGNARETGERIGMKWSMLLKAFLQSKNISTFHRVLFIYKADTNG